MPLYRAIVLLKPDTSPRVLTGMFRSVARLVYRERGNFRSVENMGVRPLATPIARGGVRFEDARMVTCGFDANPAGRKEVDSLLRVAPELLGLEISTPDAPEDLARCDAIPCFGCCSAMRMQVRLRASR